MSSSTSDNAKAQPIRPSAKPSKAFLARVAYDQELQDKGVMQEGKGHLQAKARSKRPSISQSTMRSASRSRISCGADSATAGTGVLFLCADQETP